MNGTQPPKRSVSGDGAARAGGAPPLLPCQHVADIPPLSPGGRWLIEELWVEEGAGLVGGPPKAGKSWLVLDLALSVASGTKALGRFAVGEAGPVLIFPAEDGAKAVRSRLDALARPRGVAVTPELPLHVITADSLKLDDDAHRSSLEELLGRMRPRLLVLDPLVRLHSRSENSAEHVAELLGYLRRVQRRFAVAVMVTHHVSKRLSHHPGDALRGSSDLHAWGDSNLYLQRLKGERGAAGVRLTIEHRFASSPEPYRFRLHAGEAGCARIEVEPESDIEDAGTEEREAVRRPAAVKVRDALPPLRDRVLTLLHANGTPLSQRAIRAALRVRNSDLTAALRELEASASAESLGRMGGWRARSHAHRDTPPAFFEQDAS